MDEAIRGLVAQGMNLPRFLALAEVERAMPVAARRLRAAASDQLDPDAAATLWRHAQVAEFRMGHLQSRLGQTLDRLEGAGVHVVLLKGAAVAATAFSSFVERPMGDVDLLVDESVSTVAIEAALEAGWRRDAGADDGELYAEHHHLAPLIDGTGAGFALELHTNLFLPGHPFGLTAAHVRRRSVQRELGGRPVVVPHPADQIVHACIHFAWGHMLRGAAWRTFRDVDALLTHGGVSWSELIELARETRSWSCVYWTLRLARTAAGMDVPDGVLAELRPGDRTPEGALRWVERHALAQLLPSEIGCPSVRLQKGMWTLAIRPGRSGHGDVRPWARTAEWAAFAERHGAPDTRRAGIADWFRYARTLMGS